MKLIKITLWFLLLFYSNITLGCYIAPKGSHISPQQLLASSENIIFVKAESVSFSRESYSYNFKVIEDIKGNYARDTFSITEPLGSFIPNELLEYSFSKENKPNSDFNFHQDKQFWEEGDIGRLGVYKDCNIYTYFQLGESYLVTLGKNKSVKSYELIADKEKDLWYKKAKEIYK